MFIVLFHTYNFWYLKKLPASIVSARQYSIQLMYNVEFTEKVSVLLWSVQQLMLTYYLCAINCESIHRTNINLFLILRSRYCWHDLQDCLSFLVNMTFLVIIAYWAEELFVSSDIVVLPKRCCRFWWCHHFGSNFPNWTTGRTKNIRIKNIRLKECYCGMNSNFWDGL